jgi:glycosyltransferase involved in cell wall biosynthesis
MLKSIIKKTPLYRPMAILYDWVNFNIQFITTIKRILIAPRETRTFFFFPFYHTGGAELVHLNIVKATQGKTVTFFTLPSANAHFLSEFQQYTDCQIIEKMIRIGWRKKLMLRCISFKINRQKSATVFGCHSLFFYELLPYLKKDIKCIDLIHAFTHADEPGFEKESLPYIQRLNKRVTISKKGKKDLIEQYEKMKISVDLTNRIEVIYNSTNFTCSEIPNKATDVFNVVYVGRNSPEKRISLMGKIATELKKINEEFNFIFVGEDLELGVNPEDCESCIFTGNITELEELEQIYRSAHVVLIASTREGIPMVLIEGMVFGVIPVSTDVGGVTEIVEHNVNGKIVPFSNSQSQEKELFLTAITHLKEDNALFKLCSQNSYEKAKKSFSESAFRKKYIEIICS